MRSQASCRRERCFKTTSQSGKAKPAVGEKVALEQPATCGEAKPAVGEKLNSKQLVETVEAKTSVGKEVALEPPAKI